MNQHDDMPDLQTQVEGGTPHIRAPRAETPAEAYNNRTLRSEAFEAAWGRVMRDHYNPGENWVAAMYKACAEGWIAGFEYGQQS